MITFARSALVIAFSLFLLNSSPQVFGQTTTATAPAKVKKIPFHGKVVAIDTSAETITLNGKSARVLHLTPTTKITDGAGAASTFSAATVGEDVGGSYIKDASGTLSLSSLRIGAKTKEGEAAAAAPAPAPAPASAPEPAPAPAAASTPVATPAPAAAPAAAATTKVKKQSFSGTVVSVDSAANTLVVHGKADQTFTVTSTTKISGTASTLAALTAGSKVSGSYSKSADGTTLTVYTLKVK